MTAASAFEQPWTSPIAIVRPTVLAPEPVTECVPRVVGFHYCPPLTQPAGKRAKVIVSYADFAPHSYRQPTSSPGSPARHEYAAGPGCSTFDAAHVFPSS